MKGWRSKPRKGTQVAAQTGHVVDPTNAFGPVGPQASLLALQRAAGNHAVNLLIENQQGSSLEASLTNSRAVQLDRSAGQPLSPTLSASLGQSFGRSVEDVRIHSNAQSAHVAQSLEAHAFTIGRDIYFNAGKFQPETKEGYVLLAHELAHTIQNGGHERESLKDPTLIVDSPDSSLERNAQEAGQQAVQTRTNNLSNTVVESATGSTWPQIQRQPQTQNPVVKLQIVVFAAGKTDVAGARRTAENFVRKIQQHQMTDDDYEVLRQAVGYFKGKALTEFRSVIDSAIQDRDILSEVWSNAPHAPGKPWYPPLLVSAKSNPKSTADAKRVGTTLGDKIRKGSVTEDLRDDIEAYLMFFQGKAKAVFRAEIKRAFDDLETKTESHTEGERKLLSTRQGMYGSSYGPTSRFQSIQTEISTTGIPRSIFKANHRMYAEIRSQTSNSVSVEYYSDISVGAEASLKIPIKKVIDIKVGAAYKKGRKEAEKKEKADVRVSGRRISRNYQIESLERDVIRKTFREERDETRLKGGGLVIADNEQRQLLSSHEEVQAGYRLISSEDRTVKEFWPSYIGQWESKTAAQKLVAALDEEGVKMAELLAKLEEGGF